MSYKARNRLNILVMCIILLVVGCYALVFLTSIGWKLLGLIVSIGIVSLITFKLADINSIYVEVDKVVLASRKESIPIELSIQKKSDKFMFFPVFSVSIEELGITKRIYGYTGKKLIIPIVLDKKSRGKFETVTFSIRTNDLFYFFHKEIKKSQEVNWVILPETLSNVDIISSMIKKMVSEDNYGEQSYDLKGYRNYVYGDSMKQVDWKLSSKLQEVVVKEYHQEIEELPIFVFFGQTSFYFEPMLDVFFSLYQYLSNTKGEFYLLGNGVSEYAVDDVNDFAKVSKSLTKDLSSFFPIQKDSSVIFIPELTIDIQNQINQSSYLTSVQIITYQMLKDCGCV